MKRLFLIFILSLMLIVTPVFAQSTKTGLQNEINTNLPTTGQNEITAAILRTTLIDMVNSWVDLSGGGSFACPANQVMIGFTSLSLPLCGSLTSTFLPAFGSGDVSFVSGGGAGTIANNAVTNAKAAQMLANSVKCNPTGSTANAQDCTNPVVNGVTVNGVNAVWFSPFSQTPTISQMASGSVANPITTINPAVAISRNGAMNLIDSEGGQNAALLVTSTDNDISNNTATVVGQTQAITGYANQIGSGNSVAIFGVSTWSGTNPGGTVHYGAFGSFFEAQAEATGGTAIATELQVVNNSGQNLPLSGLIAGGTQVAMGNDDYCAGPNLCTTALQIRGNYDDGIYIANGMASWNIYTPNFTVSAAGTVTAPQYTVSGTAPSCSSTGIGSTGTCTILTGGNDSAGRIDLTAAGTGIAATGAATLTFHTALGAHSAACTFEFANNTGTWAIGASHLVTLQSNASITVQWSNVSTALSSGSAYLIDYICMGT